MAPVPQPDDHDKGPHTEDDVNVMEVPDLIINADSSDSETEDNGFQGYQMLQQSVVSDDEDDNEIDAGHDVPADTDTDSQPCTVNNEEGRLPSGLHTAGGNTPSYMKVPDLPRPNPEDLLWNQSSLNRCDIQLDPSQADTIKKTMTNIKLPNTSIPEWANEITEEQWKEKLLELTKKSS